MYNEEGRLEQKIRNTLAIDYPRDKLQFVIASDGSTDNTVPIAMSYIEDGVVVVHSDKRGGKEAAQELALSQTNSALVVFSDVATSTAPDCLRNFAECFEDERVGGVSSEDRLYRTDGRLVGEAIYVRYEMWLRRVEYRVHSLIGLTGALFAVRRELCNPWTNDLPNDFHLALEAIKCGLICVPDPRVECHYEDVGEDGHEYQRKYRTVIRGLTCVASQSTLLNPLIYPTAAFQIWSHKIARWMVPWALMSFLIFSALLWNVSPFFRTVGSLQIGFYIAAMAAMVSPPLRRILAFRVAMYFLLANAAILHASIAFVFGKRVRVWAPTLRQR